MTASYYIICKPHEGQRLVQREALRQLGVGMAEELVEPCH